MLLPRVFTRVEVFFYTNDPLLKVLLIILPNPSFIESRQCNGKREKKKYREDAAQKGKNIKPRGAPFSKQVWDPGEISPAPTPLGGPASN